MPFSTIDKPSKYFNTITWSGDNTNRTLTGVGFQPDWVWWKQRNGADDHRLIDSVRGEGTASYKILFSDTTDAEVNGNDNGGSQGNINALNSDGFSGTQGSTGWNNWNGSGYNYVGWNWLASNTTVSNTSGTITSTVSANTTAGFSIVSYTGNGTGGATIGHGLGVAPSMIILKSRSSGVEHWHVLHKSLNTAGGQYMLLSATNAVLTNSVVWNSTAPTSSVFSVGTAGGTNGSGATFIAYCFAELKGYSKFGSYTGNGSADGTFVYTGFKPKYFAWKVTESNGNSQNWYVLDTTTSPYNGINNRLHQNTTATEANMGALVDILSNGIKFRTSDTDINGSYNYIYMAFAENPFVSSKGIPCTAR